MYDAQRSLTLCEHRFLQQYLPFYLSGTRSERTRVLAQASSQLSPVNPTWTPRTIRTWFNNHEHSIFLPPPPYAFAAVQAVPQTPPQLPQNQVEGTEVSAPSTLSPGLTQSPTDAAPPAQPATIGFPPHTAALPQPKRKGRKPKAPTRLKMPPDFSGGNMPQFCPQPPVQPPPPDDPQAKSQETEAQ
jgi:hypothetical protein